MIMPNNSKKKSINDKKIFEILNEINLTEENFKDTDVTDKDIRIMKAKVFKNIGIKPKNKNIKKLAIAASIAILLSIPFLNVTVLASIKGYLQFIPGIGIVEITSSGANSYMLTKTINKPYANGKVIINGFEINNKNATLSIDGDNISYFKSVEIQNNDGSVYTMNETARGDCYDRNKLCYWSKSYKYSGDIKPGKNYTIILNKEIKIPLSLVADNDVRDLNSLGPTVSVDGINLTALSSIEGDKLRVNLLAPQNNVDKRLNYPDTHISINNEKHITKGLVNGILAKSSIYITDTIGNKYPAYMSSNITMSGQEYYFKTGNDITKHYTLTIPKILMDYNSKTPFSIDLPKVGDSTPKQTINIAGYPVAVSIKKVSDAKVRVTVGLNYNKDSKTNLISFSLSSPSIKNDALFEQTTQLQPDLSSSPAYFEFSIDKNTNHLNLEFIHPEIESQGPWNFNVKLKK